MRIPKIWFWGKAKKWAEEVNWATDRQSSVSYAASKMRSNERQCDEAKKQLEKAFTALLVSTGQMVAKDMKKHQEKNMEDMSQRLESMAAVLNTAVEKIEILSSTLEQMQSNITLTYQTVAMALVNEMKRQEEAGAEAPKI